MNRLAKLASALTVLAVLPAGAAAQTSKCRPADDVSQVLINHLKEMMTTTDPVRINARNNIFRVPAVSASQVTLVTDAARATKPPWHTGRLREVQRTRRSTS